MNILYHHRIASKDGQYVHIDEIINAFEEQGHNVEMLSPGIAESGDFGHDGGLATRLKKMLPKVMYELLELGYSVIPACKLLKSILSNRPDFIYERYNLYQPAGVIVGKLLKIPVILEVNAPLKEEREKHCGGLALPRLAKWVENFTWKLATHTLPVTQVLATHLQEAGVPVERITVLHNGVRQSMLDDALEDSKGHSGPIHIGFVGFMNLTCGLDDAILTMAKHKDKNIVLTCIGNGDEIERLKLLAADCGVADKVVFTGLLSRSVVFDHVKKFDIALQPAVTAYASPLKMFEYMLARCLIVAPRTPNIEEILSDDSALLFDERAQFAPTLEFAIEHFDELTDKRNAAFSSLSDNGFVWQENTKKITALCNKK